MTGAFRLPWGHSRAGPTISTFPPTPRLAAWWLGASCRPKGQLWRSQLVHWVAGRGTASSTSPTSPESSPGRSCQNTPPVISVWLQRGCSQLPHGLFEDLPKALSETQSQGLTPALQRALTADHSCTPGLQGARNRRSQKLGRRGEKRKSPLPPPCRPQTRSWLSHRRGGASSRMRVWSFDCCSALDTIIRVGV